MKKALSLVLALAIFASCFCGFGSSAQKANLICVDEETADTLIQSAWMPDFGSGEGQHSIPALACWIMGDTPWQDSISFDTEVKKFGERSIHIKYNTGAKNNYGGVYALIPSNLLEKGKTYTYQAYVKTNKLMGDLGAIINLGAEKASGGAPDGYTGVPHSEVISGTKDWQLLSITFECQYSDPDIYYQFWCTANEVMNGEVWFDGMALVEGSEPVKDYASLAPVAAPNVPTTPSAEPTPEPTTAPAVEAKPVPAGEKFYNAPYGKPVIDGTVDAIWDTAEWTVIDVPNSKDEVATGSQIKAKLLWDEEKLYFLAEIYDTDHNKDTDIFELYVDQKNDKTYSFKRDDSHTRFKLSGGVVQNSGENCQNDAENACVQDGNNFILEGAIVWTEGAPVAGQQMGLEFMYNDGGADSEFLAAFRWNVDMATAGALPFQCTRDWGYLNLMPAVVVPTLNGEPSAWAKEEILKALEADLVPEHVNSNYTTDITRSDFCDLIIKMIEKKSGKAIADVIAGYADAKADVSFPDTDSANVIAAAKLGIVNGRSSGAFDPTANITRQEAAKMLALAAKVLGADITASEVAFADADDIYAWAKEFIYYVNTIGVMNGTSTTTPPNFSPLRTYTREQSILTVYRLFNAMTTAVSVADAYAGNLLDFTEENISAIWDRQPWEANSEDKFYAWGQPGTVVPSDYKSINNGETSAAFSFTYEDEATVADKNKAAGKVTRAIKVDLSKLNIEANLPHIQGNFLDVYTDSCEAGKDYTFFFMVKLSEDATDNSIVLGSFNESSLTDLKADPQYVYSNIDDKTHVLANVVATKEWQLVKYTFTAKSPLAGPLTGIVINVGKQAATAGYLYIDGIALVEGRMSDADAFYMN